MMMVKPLKVSIFVPSTDVRGSISPMRHKMRAERVAKFLSEQFGGATMVYGLGSWVDGNGALINEPVIIVWAFADVSDKVQVAQKVASYCARERKEWDQDQVLFTVENVPGIAYFVDESAQ